jgi:hypothetical protein
MRGHVRLVVDAGLEVVRGRAVIGEGRLFLAVDVDVDLGVRWSWVTLSRKK